MKIETVSELKKAIRTPYAWPGGYPVYVVLADGGLMCHKCARKEFRYMAGALLNGEKRSDWFPLGADILWETESVELCAGCNAEIESAYGVIDSE